MRENTAGVLGVGGGGGNDMTSLLLGISKSIFFVSLLFMCCDLCLCGSLCTTSVYAFFVS